MGIKFFFQGHTYAYNKKEGLNYMSTISSEIKYFNIYRSATFPKFVNMVNQHYEECYSQNQNIVFLCIGSDRATGDCLGPVTGHLLMKKKKSLPVFGTLASPVHAQNLGKTIDYIYDTISRPYIIAIDASLGIRQHIGHVTSGSGPLSPGIGVNKKLPCVGDAFITGIVNASNSNSHLTLQTTKLSTVVDLAEFIAHGILKAAEKRTELHVCSSFKCPV